MTKDEINRAVAEKVMGWQLQPPCYGSPSGWWNSPDELDVEDWNPAERIDHAWMVVEKLKATIQVGTVAPIECLMWIEEDFYNGVSDTAPMAICLAALEAKE